jgi:predicted DNA-binding ribbon-helix-helix protein
MDLSRKTLDELKRIAKNKNVKGYASLRKPALIRLLGSLDSSPSVCENMERVEVLRLAKRIGINPQKTVQELCAEINEKNGDVSKFYNNSSSLKIKTLNSLQEKLSTLLYNQTPLSDQAIEAVMKSAAVVVQISQGKINKCGFTTHVPPRQIYDDLLRILESDMIADLYMDYVNDPDPGPIPFDLERILVGEAILSTFENYVEILTCPDIARYIYSGKLRTLLKA